MYTYINSIKTQFKSHTYNRTFFAHPKLKNYYLYSYLY